MIADSATTALTSSGFAEIATLNPQILEFCRIQDVREGNRD